MSQNYMKKEKGKETIYIELLTFMSGVQFPELC